MTLPFYRIFLCKFTNNIIMASKINEIGYVHDKGFILYYPGRPAIQGQHNDLILKSTDSCGIYKIYEYQDASELITIYPELINV